MRQEFTDVLRDATAIQVAVFELHDENVHGEIAGPALSKCLAQLIVDVRKLLRHVKS